MNQHSQAVHAAVINRRGGPYASAASRVVGHVPTRIRTFFIVAGGMTTLLGRVLWSAFRHPRGYWGAVFEEIDRTAREAFLPIAAALFAFLMFLSVLVVQFLDVIGAAQVFGPFALVFNARTATIWVLSTVVAGLIGAALTSDVGARKVREELDAMQVMGIDPVRDIGVPRVVSLALLTVLLSIPTYLVTMLSCQLGVAYVAHMPAADFYHNAFSALSPVDIAGFVINSLLVGVLIGTVCCYKGLTASGGATGLGRAVNQAVVQSLVGVWVMQLAYLALLLGLFPELGRLA